MDQAEIKKLLRLYLVMGLNHIGGKSPLDIAMAAIDGGVTVIQLREKNAPLKDVLSRGAELRALCRDRNIPFIVNDRVDVALLLDADGVHVGQDDIPGLEARRLLGPGKIVGISAGTAAEAEWAVGHGADYLGIGPVYATATKADAGEAIGTELLEDLTRASGLPTVGIGGIGPANARLVAEAGADGVAVVSAITQQADPKEAARVLRAAIDPFYTL